MRVRHLCFVLFILATFAQAQPNRFTHLTVGDLNAETSVSLIHQDRQGFLWVGTMNGLFRYDGQNMVTHRNHPQKENTLNHNLVSALVETGQELWIGTWGNGNVVNRLNKRTGAISRIRLVRDLNPAYSTALTLHDGSILIGGANSICHFLPGSAQHDVLASERVSSFWEDADHTVWAASQDGKLLHIRVEKPRLVLLDSLRFSHSINTIVPDKQGRVWFGTDKGLQQWRGKPQPIPDALRNKAITSICAAFDGSLWIGTQKHGLFRWDSQTNRTDHFVSDERPNNLHSNVIQHVFEDQSHLLWIGTEKGLYFTDLIPSPFQQIPFADSQGNDGLPLYEDTNGILWVGGQNFVWQYDRRTQRYLPDKIPTTRTTQIIPNKDGNIWITALTAQKVGPYQPNQKPQVLERLIESPQKPVYKPGFFVMTTLEDKAHNQWFGMYFQGVSMREPSGQWHHYGKDVIGGIAVSRIIQARDGTIWISKWDSGLSHLTGGTWQKPEFEHFRPNQDKTKDTIGTTALSYSVASDLMEDRNGNIWIATFGGGINVLNPKTKKIQIFTESDGLPSNSVLTVLEDNQGMIWLSTLNGLARLDPQTRRFVTYKTKDGLPSNTFLFFGKAKNAKGELFWGTNGHIVVLDPKKLTQTINHAPVYLTDLKLFNQSVIPSADGILNHQLMFTNQVRVPYSQAMLTLDFASLFYRNPTQVQYAYRLKGFDDTWNYVSNQRTATYTYPTPGSYEFQVKASLDGQTWTELVHPLTIVVEPEWYQTLWFRAGMLLLLLGGLLGLYLYRLHILQQRQKAELAVMTRTQETERKRFAEDLHDGLGANLSLLKLYLNMLGDSKVPVIELKQRSENLINDSLDDLRRLIHDLSPRTLASIGLVNALHELARRVNATGKLEVAFQATGFTEKLEHSLEIHLYRMVQELLQNALKHAQASHVSLTLSRTPDGIQLTYEDNGIGFDVAQATSRSNGLQNLRHRAQLLGGRYEVMSESGQGTQTHIEIPV
ncbi:sensor histidine kinase [Larkinella humicola]|uniref:Histidine kinase domain-containing protein n=1 Tax=Larkinella humicola TaxID=2607654 RepID=A0A5N1JHB0_9BACT|nr:sensor histidine kinase [Larkinella humicola]KAA9352721.1 hypothetical protein F0P93_16150 [Larkinella humicola]